MYIFCVTQGPQRPAPDNGFLQTGSGEEGVLPGGGVGLIGGGGGLHSLWYLPRHGHFLLVPREGSLGGQQQLAGGGSQPAA